jgi:hypothetical protein
LENKGGSVAESHAGGQRVILHRDIFALFGEGDFGFLLQENKVIVISQIFVLAQSLLIPVTLTSSFDFSLTRQLALIDQEL